MRKVKRVFALLMAMVMTLSLGITALAADDGTITITNATVGKDYTIYKIFEASTAANDSTKVAYLATEEQKNFFEGQTGNVFAFEETKVTGKYNVSVAKKDEGTTYTDAEVVAFLQGFVTKNETTGVITVNVDFANVITTKNEWTKTADDKTVTFSDLPYGYYLVTSSLGATVTVDSTKPMATVIDKNQTGPDWTDKTKTITAVGGVAVNGTDVQEISANYGDTISYQVQFDATNYDGEKKISSYEITDILAAGLEYLLKEGKLDVTVKVGEQTLAAEKYVVSAITDVKNDDDEVTGHTVKITIPWMESTTTDGVTTYTDFLYPSPSTITVTYSAIVNSNAEIAGTGNGNTAALTYYTLDDDGNPEPSEEIVTSETTVYTFALAINKIDPKGVALEGAVFRLKDAAGNLIPVKQATSDGTVIPGVYEYDDTDYTVEGAGTPNYDVVSPSNGVIVVKGVKEGTYTVTETKAPDGYNLLTETKEVEAVITNITNYSKTITIYKDEKGNVVDVKVGTGTTETVTTDVSVSAINVVNASGSELPSTGGMGTTIFYVLGGILVLGAVVLLITKRRMNAEK